MSDLSDLAGTVSIIIRIDTSRPRDNVSVDLGLVPPVLAVDALRQAFEAVCEHQEDQQALVVFRSQVVEPVHSAAEDDE